MDLKPPTDNLYKFIAISGILLVGFGVWTTSGHSNQIRSAQFDAREKALANPAFAEIEEERIGALDDNLRVVEYQAGMAVKVGAALLAWGIAGWLMRVHPPEAKTLRYKSRQAVAEARLAEVQLALTYGGIQKQLDDIRMRLEDMPKQLARVEQQLERAAAEFGGLRREVATALALRQEAFNGLRNRISGAITHVAAGHG